jgi:hypothetical protein
MRLRQFRLNWKWMNERKRIIEKLVTEMHLSVPERAAVSSNTVRYSEVAAVIIRVLKETGYFPPNARPWQEGKVVHEGAILQQLSNRRYRLTLQRSHPTAPTVLAAKKESDYMLARTAVRAFVRSEWPNGIDGIRIGRIGILGV